jgi:hypothetical protein
LWLRKAKKTPYSENAIPELGAVMRSLRLVDFVEMLSQDRGGVLETAEQNLVELGLAESSLRRLGLASSFCDFQTEGKTEQSLRVEEGTDCAGGKPTTLPDDLKSSMCQCIDTHLSGRDHCYLARLARFTAPYWIVWKS